MKLVDEGIYLYIYDDLGKLCDGPWQDPLVRIRDVLKTRGPEYTFGSTDCAYGYEGII